MDAGVCYILICYFLLSLLFQSPHTSCLFEKKAKQTNKSCQYCPLQSAGEADTKDEKVTKKPPTSMQLGLIFHPSITHSSDYRLTCSNWKQRNADYVLLLIFHTSELSNNHHAPGHTPLCHDLGLMWPSPAALSVPSWAQAVFSEGLTVKPVLFYGLFSSVFE